MHIRQMIPLALVALTVCLVGGQLFQNAPAPADTASTPRTLSDTVNAPEEAAAVIVNQARQPIGLLRMQPGDNGMMNVLVVARGIEPGFHAVHIHETGQCQGDFSSAGNHFDKGNNAHPHHSGDLPSLRMPAGDDKVGAMLFVTDAFTMADVLADDGTAVIIHAGADNFGNIPQRYGGPDSETLKAGDSGPRTGCGVIRERSSIPQFDALLHDFDVSLSLDGLR